MIDHTKIVRPLTSDEKQMLTNELFQVPSEYWVHHAKNLNKTALRYGLSYHMRWIENLEITKDNWFYFPKTKIFLESFQPTLTLGRVYWHCLKSHQKILQHNDLYVLETQKPNFITRWQIYLDIPNNFFIMLDNKFVQDPKVYSNTIVEFALSKNHCYINNSTTNFYILVFDFLQKYGAP